MTCIHDAWKVWEDEPDGLQSVVIEGVVEESAEEIVDVNIDRRYAECQECGSQYNVF